MRRPREGDVEEPAFLCLGFVHRDRDVVNEVIAGGPTDPDEVARVERMRPIAERLGCSMAQLALAWCTRNPHVSTVITGASKVSQVVQNFETVDVIPLLTDEVKEEIEAAIA